MSVVVVVKHPEAFVTEEARVARSKPVVGRQPSANVDVADGTSARRHPVLVGQERVELLVQTVTLMGQSYVCDDDEVLAVSLVTVEVGEAHFDLQIHKLGVLHLGLLVGREVVALGPFYRGATDVLTLGESHVIVENSFQEEEGRLVMILADEVRSDVGRVAELSTHLQVTDTANGVPQVCQCMGPGHQQSHVGSNMLKSLEDGGVVDIDTDNDFSFRNHVVFTFWLPSNRQSLQFIRIKVMSTNFIDFQIRFVILSPLPLYQCSERGVGRHNVCIRRLIHGVAAK